MEAKIAPPFPAVSVVYVGSEDVEPLESAPLLLDDEMTLGRGIFVTTDVPPLLPGVEDVAGVRGIKGIGTLAELLEKSIVSAMLVMVTVDVVKIAPPACWDRLFWKVRFSRPSKVTGPVE